MGKIFKSYIQDINTPRMMESIVKGLFPIDQHKNVTVCSTEEKPAIITESDLTQTARLLSVNKLPRPDKKYQTRS